MSFHASVGGPLARIAQLQKLTQRFLLSLVTTHTPLRFFSSLVSDTVAASLYPHGSIGEIGLHGRESRLCFADMVLLETLRDKCSLWLQDQLTVDNVAVLWERASHANARGLEAACEAFMVCTSLSQACRASVSSALGCVKILSVSLWVGACYYAASPHHMHPVAGILV